MRRPAHVRASRPARAAIAAPPARRALQHPAPDPESPVPDSSPAREGPWLPPKWKLKLTTGNTRGRDPLTRGKDLDRRPKRLFDVDRGHPLDRDREQRKPPAPRAHLVSGRDLAEQQRVDSGGIRNHEPSRGERVLEGAEP